MTDNLHVIDLVMLFDVASSTGPHLDAAVRDAERLPGELLNSFVLRSRGRADEIVIRTKVGTFGDSPGVRLSDFYEIPRQAKDFRGTLAAIRPGTVEHRG